MKIVTIPVSNTFGGSVQCIENFYSMIEGTPPADQYAFDMRAVKFVRPYGIVALVISARHLSGLSGRPVRLENLVSNIHLYLHRMNFFEVGSDWLQPVDTLNEEWFRNPQTPNLLELTAINGPEDVVTATSRTKRIFSHWLAFSNLSCLINVLSELCANIYQHSGDHYGCVLIQKYESLMHGYVSVDLAVGDMGCGIRESLLSRHGKIGQDPLDYLYEAMHGRTARLTGRGGLGLRRVEQIISSKGGHLWLRSETAAIFSQGQGTVKGYQGLALIPGTQVAVESALKNTFSSRKIRV